MTSEEWQDLMTLMSLVIFADRKIYKEEVDTFVSTISQLNETISPGMLMTESMAFEWFKSNRDKVKNLLVGPKVEQTIRDLIRRTKNIPNKPAIIAAMKNIAQADSDFHRSEHHVIRKAAEGWGVPYSD